MHDNYVHLFMSMYTRKNFKLGMRDFKYSNFWKVGHDFRGVFF